MTRAWYQDHLEVFVRTDQRIDNLQGRSRIYIATHLPHRKQQLTSQLSGVCDV